MAKRRIKVEMENELHDAIQQEAAKRGTSKAAVVRSCAQIYLSKVNDTSRPKKSKFKRDI